MPKSNSQNASSGVRQVAPGPVSETPARGGDQVDRVCPSVDRYADIGASCPDLRKRYDVDIREFVVLARLCNAGPAGVTALSEFLQLSPTSTGACLTGLERNHLVRPHDPKNQSYAATRDGIALVRNAELMWE